MISEKDKESPKNQKGKIMAITFEECKTTKAVKDKVRSTAFSDLITAFSELYGVDNVSIVGNSEIAVAVGDIQCKDGTLGEVCFTVKPPGIVNSDSSTK